jgi:rare lipoprotein A (peptidoglycan hydrolase)
MKIAKINKFNYLYIIWYITPLLILNLSIFAPLAAEETVVEEPVSLEQIVYTVKPGDSLNRIADNYKVLLSDLKAWNDITSEVYLHPGDALIVKHVEYEAREGLASWYGPNFHGRNMANTEVFDMHDIVVAHRTLPLGRMVRVTNLENGRSIIAPVLDRGPYVKDASGSYTREIDLSYGVAKELGTIERGVVRALVEPINEPLNL